MRAFPATTEPAESKTPLSARPKTAAKPKHHGSNKRRTVQIYGWVRREVAAEIERLRDQGGVRLSRSAVVASLLERALQANIDMQYGALLRPIIEGAIAVRSRARDARFAALLVRIAYDAGQTRSLVTNLLARAPGVNPEILQTILDRSDERASANLTHLSPQIADLIAAVEQWMTDGAEEGSVPA